MKETETLPKTLVTQQMESSATTTYNKPVNYWDYIEVDTLLSIQRPRTIFKDEEVFIVYHQITELYLKLVIHELRQICEEQCDIELFITRMDRIKNYVHQLIGSFSIMKTGMSYDQYNLFRRSLSPASGFQSVQYRIIELYCTDLVNLVNDHGKERLGNNHSFEALFQNLYWRDAGTNWATGEKSPTLKAFTDRYEKGLLELAMKLQQTNINQLFPGIESGNNERLRNVLREFDHLYNIQWPLVHLETAQAYLNKKGENQEGTGGSQWQRYLHPATQRRIFFPSLWSASEITKWGVVLTNS